MIYYFYTRLGIKIITMNDTLSKFIKAKRRALKLTQHELSDKAGVGIRFIRELEAGKNTLRIDKVNQVFDLFGYELGPVPISRNFEDNEKS